MDRLYKFNERVLAKLEKRLPEEVGYRADMHLADYTQVNNTTAKVLIAYSKELGKVDSNDVNRFFVHSFEGKILPVMTTARRYKDLGQYEAISVVACVPTECRKLEAKERMVAVASTLFVDTVLNDMWEVQAHDDGTKFLQRINKENIGEIISERKRRMAVQASTITFETLAQVGKGVAHAEPGDKVKFYYDGATREGTISSVTDQGYTISEDGGGSVKVAKEAIVEVVELGEGTKKQLQEELKDYYEQAFGFEDYATQLTRDAGESL